MAPRLNYFLGPLPKFNKYPKFSTALAFVLDLIPGQVAFTDEQVAELQKALNNIITKNLVKFKFASCKQKLASIDCRVCNSTHAPGNCKQKQRRDRAASRGRAHFSGHVSAVDRASGIQDVNRYASLQRTIENELAERQHD